VRALYPQVGNGVGSGYVEGTLEPAESSAKKRFGAELRAHRAGHGWTQVELGGKLGYSGSFVSDVERGDKGTTDDFAKRSDEVFGLPGSFLRLWEDLQREQFPTWFAPIVPIEREAAKISGWEPSAVPGLLQTERYARALIKARRPGDDDETVESAVQARMERQGTLTRPKPPLCCYILAEGVLRQAIGGAEVMQEQLDKIITAANTPGFVLQVLPFSAQQHAGIDGHLYLYERPQQPIVAYSECIGGGRLVEDSREVSDLATVMGMLRAAALPPWDSVALMRTLRRDFER
jgi:transcriptional regulator with XRE-family HTH domain